MKKNRGGQVLAVWVALVLLMTSLNISAIADAGERIFSNEVTFEYTPANDAPVEEGGAPAAEGEAPAAALTVTYHTAFPGYLDGVYGGYAEASPSDEELSLAYPASETGYALAGSGDFSALPGSEETILLCGWSPAAAQLDEAPAYALGDTLPGEALDPDGDGKAELFGVWRTGNAVQPPQTTVTLIYHFNYPSTIPVPDALIGQVEGVETSTSFTCASEADWTAYSLKLPAGRALTSAADELKKQGKVSLCGWSLNPSLPVLSPADANAIPSGDNQGDVLIWRGTKNIQPAYLRNHISEGQVHLYGVFAYNSDADMDEKTFTIQYESDSLGRWGEAITYSTKETGKAYLSALGELTLLNDVSPFNIEALTLVGWSTTTPDQVYLKSEIKAGAYGSDVMLAGTKINTAALGQSDSVTLYAVWQQRNDFKTSMSPGWHYQCYDGYEHPYPTRADYPQLTWRWNMEKNAYTLRLPVPDSSDPDWAGYKNYLARSGYDFQGWGDHRDRSKCNVFYTAGTELVASSQREIVSGLYANYSKTLSFDAAYSGVTIPSQTVTYTCGYNDDDHASNAGYSVTFPTIDPAIQEAFDNSLLGWADSENATAPTYTPGQEITIRGEMTFYAVWKYPIYTVNAIENVQYTGAAYELVISGFSGEDTAYAFYNGQKFEMPGGKLAFTNAQTWDDLIVSVEREGTEVWATTTTVSIAPMPVTITAVAAEKTYGEADPAFPNATISSFVGDDLNSLSLAVVRADAGDDTPGVHSGVLSIAQTAQALAFLYPNYTFTVTPADFTILTNATALAVSASDVEIMYDGAFHGVSPVATVNGTPVATATITYLDANGTPLAAAPEWQDVGGGEVRFRASLDGYQDVEASARVTITPRPIRILVSSTSHLYDGLSHSAVWAAAGVSDSNGTDVGGLAATDQASIPLVNAARTEVGVQTVTIDQAAATITRRADGANVMSNYAITWTDGSITITSAATSYTVNYYYDNALAPNATVTLAGDLGDVITTYPGRNLPGMRFDRADGLPLILGADATGNVIDVYYETRNAYAFIVDVETPLAGSRLSTTTGDLLE